MSNDEWNIKGVEKEAPTPEKAVVATKRSPPPARKNPKEIRARRLLTILTEDHNFDVIKEMVKTYQEIQTLQNDMDRIRLSLTVQKELLKYCFPAIRPDESGGEKPGVVFNINLGGEPEAPPMKNITPKNIEGGRIEVAHRGIDANEEDDEWK